MKKLLILIILFTTNVYAQQITWQKYYFSSSQYNGCYGIVALIDSGFVVLANSPPYINGGHIFKVDKFGDTLWVKKYGWAIHMIKTNDDGFALSGTIIDTNQSVVPYLLKLDINGDSLWTQIYSNYSGGVSVTQLKDSGYVICGDHFLFKTDALGNIIWSKNIPASGGVLECYNGDLFFYGGNNANCYIAALLTSTGFTKWNKNYVCISSGSLSFSLLEAVQLPDSNFAVISSSYQIINAGWDFMKINKDNGDTLSTKIFPWKVTSVGSIALTKDSNIILTLEDKLAKIDFEGGIIWSDTISFIAYDLTTSLDGGFGVAGIEYSGGPGTGFPYHYRSVYAKLDSLGNIYNFQGIPSIAVNELRVYPKPAFNQLAISSEQLANGQEVTVIIYDVLGKVQLQQKIIPQGDFKVDVNGLSSGLYMLQLKQEGRLFNGRFLKE